MPKSVRQVAKEKKGQVYGRLEEEREDEDEEEEGDDVERGKALDETGIALTTAVDETDDETAGE